MNSHNDSLNNVFNNLFGNYNFQPVNENVNENYQRFEQRQENTFYLNDGRRIHSLMITRQENGLTIVSHDRSIGDRTLREVTTYTNENQLRNRRRFTRGFNPSVDNVNQFIEEFNSYNQNNNWQAVE